MAAFNDLNGVPCTVNQYTIRHILKELYGLPGFVVSDANGIKECVTHGIAENDMDAGRQAISAGLDMDMGTNIYKNYLKECVENGSVSIEMIDEAVRRILSVKVWLGLFENPYVLETSYAQYAPGRKLPEEHVRTALEAAEKSIVLLKNEGNILPLKKETKISLVGELAANAEEVCGAWAMSWKKEDCVSILDGMKNYGDQVSYFPCGGPEGELNDSEISRACEQGDVIVAVVGELVTMTGEASSKANIELPGKQRELLEKLLESGKPVVAVLMNGRPLALGWEDEHLPVIVEAWHLGIQMGNAVAKMLFGETEPTARLASSFPSVNGQCPVYYNHPNTGRPGSRSKFTSRYLDAPHESLYPFGYGLGYTTFEYDSMTVEDTGNELEISVNVINTGKQDGTEVTQLYMQDITASLVRPVKELKGFCRTELKAGEKKKVVFRLKKADMGFYDNEGRYLLENGMFALYAGGNSRDCLRSDIRICFEN